MKKINTYISEKLILNKDSREPLTFEERYAKDSKVLMLIMENFVDPDKDVISFFEAAKIISHKYEEIKIEYLTNYHITANPHEINTFEYNDNHLVSNSNDKDSDKYILVSINKNNVIILIDQYNAEREIIKNADNKHCISSFKEIENIKKLFKDA